MENISLRISFIVKESKLTKSDFAKKINVSQSHVSRLCKGETQPSDRTISDICKEFNFNEEWLRYGKGCMKKPVNRNKEIENFMDEVLHMESEDFRRRLVNVLTRLDEKEWELLESMALKLADETKSTAPEKKTRVIKIAGRDGSMEELALTDEDENEYLNRIDQYPDATDDL